MKRRELRETVIGYCDVCGCEVTGSYTTIESKDGTRHDACHEQYPGDSAPTDGSGGGTSAATGYRRCCDVLQERLNWRPAPGTGA